MMRIILPLFALLLFTGSSFGQSSLVVHYTSNSFAISDNMSEFDHYATVVNAGTSAMYVKVKRSVMNLSTGHSTQFCFQGNCYLPSTNISGDSAYLQPGDSATTFIGKMIPGGVNGYDIVNYCYYDVANM